MSAGFDFASCSEEQLWRFVAAHLERQGIGVVLVGGAVVAVYTRGAYRSGDLDFVQVESFGADLEAAMAEIGFRREGRHFVHPRCSHLFVEFVSGPLGIGEDTRIEPWEEREGEVHLRILSPTDCVRDRLASYIHFQARECLDQAVLVARCEEVRWERIATWCRDEGTRGPEAYVELRRLVAASFGRADEHDPARWIVRLRDHGIRLISRSEARRVAVGLEQQRDVILDFENVDAAGQGFVDELFRVWQNAHPEVRLVPRGMNPKVEFMVRRGLPGPHPRDSP